MNKPRSRILAIPLVAAASAAFAGGLLAQSAPAPRENPPPLIAVPELQGVKVAKDVVYATPAGKPVLLDLYVPDLPAGLHPLIIWVHGGGWLGGDKSKPPALALFTGHGYALASIDYTLTQVAKWPAQIYDCKAAIRWLRAHAGDYNLDPERFGVWGGSAGGHLVAMIGVTGGMKQFEGDLGNPGVSSRVQAVADCCGPSDFTTIENFKSEEDWENRGSVTTRLLGGPISKNLEIARLASPVTWIAKDDPPFLVMHGEKDTDVPFNQGEAFAAALAKAGVSVKFAPVAGAGHNLFFPATFSIILDFFDDHLKPKK